MKVSVPTKGSVAILKASAENGSASSGWRSMVLLGSSASTPVMAGTSVGAGMNSTTASSMDWTPLFLKALPQSVSTISLWITRWRRPALMSARDRSPSSR